MRSIKYILSISMTTLMCLMMLPDTGQGADTGFASYEATLLEKINWARSNPAQAAARGGLTVESIESMDALVVNDVLNQSADSHTQDMTSNHYYGYDSYDGVNPETRILTAGYKGTATGEMIGIVTFNNYMPPEIAVKVLFQQLVRRDLNQTVLENRRIFNDFFRDVGIAMAAGVVKVGNRAYNAYVLTVDFGIEIDTDSDGTPDGNDECPNDPNKIKPGECGCGVADSDTDGDGITDCNDACPNDPDKIEPGECGCGVADTDTDGDGIADCNDACPNDPNKIEPGECGCGVADSDTDGDGIADCNDACPNDPNKIEPGECGCGVADSDTDGDGIADCNDACPNDSNKIEPGECGCGVADSDTDGDGITDCNDACPNDPNKIKPGECGCGAADTDTDGDGIADCLDACPNDPNKIKPGECGCGAADIDTDGDGKLDCNDACPNDPNKIEPGGCGCGTVDTDTDGDGTPDCIDVCPNDPDKIEPGGCGCGTVDTDTDGDGTPDCIDGCPNDSNKIEPGERGCGIVDTDTDGDGTPDWKDACPNDPDKIDPGVCGCGTVDTDTDGDGTADCTDGCPNDSNKTEPGNCGCGMAEVTYGYQVAEYFFLDMINQMRIAPRITFERYGIDVNSMSELQPEVLEILNSGLTPLSFSPQLQDVALDRAKEIYAAFPFEDRQLTNILYIDECTEQVADCSKMNNELVITHPSTEGMIPQAVVQNLFRYVVERELQSGDLSDLWLLSPDSGQIGIILGNGQVPSDGGMETYFVLSCAPGQNYQTKLEAQSVNLLNQARSTYDYIDTETGMLLNEAREVLNANSIPPLIPDANLYTAADMHAQDMVALGYYDTYSDDGFRDVGDRIAATGYLVAAADEVLDLWIDEQPLMPDDIGRAIIDQLLAEGRYSETGSAELFNPLMKSVGIRFLYTAPRLGDVVAESSENLFDPVYSMLMVADVAAPEKNAPAVLVILVHKDLDGDGRYDRGEELSPVPLYISSVDNTVRFYTDGVGSVTAPLAAGAYVIKAHYNGLFQSRTVEIGTENQMLIIPFTEESDNLLSPESF